jgi:flagellar motor switch protein FliN
MNIPSDPQGVAAPGIPGQHSDATQFAGASPGALGLGMNFVMDVPVEVTIELGRRNMRIAEVLRLGPGSTLELDKVSGDPLDIYVNNQLIARGEAVVIGERYGVRLTEVLVKGMERG